jgi:methylenetetrahydrofolate dehydrogenase (NADP+)/methenyltetrahydrofolate cyclohydrolase
MNVGFLSTQRPGLVPCTPAGIMEMLQRSGIKIAGQEAVVIGRSDIVGKPMAMLLLNSNATVTVCHSKTRDLAEVCRRADILVAAIGRAGMVTRDFVRPGATVIDVGMNRATDLAEFQRLLRATLSREDSFRTKARFSSAMCILKSRSCGRDHARARGVGPDHRHAHVKYPKSC